MEILSLIRLHVSKVHGHWPTSVLTIAHHCVNKVGTISYAHLQSTCWSEKTTRTLSVYSTQVYVWFVELTFSKSNIALQITTLNSFVM